MISPIGRRLRLNRPGYTLIELILITIIRVILVGIATPLFRKTFSNLELKEDLFNMAKLISFAQEKAVIEGIPYRLILDTENKRYYLTKLDAKTPGKYIRLEERLGRVYYLAEGIKLTADKKELNFYPDGHSDKAAIALSRKNKTMKIGLKGSLGYVEIEEGRL